MRIGKERLRYLLEGVVDEFGNDSCQEWALSFEAGVGVDLDEAELELVVEHEVVAEDLKRVHQPLGVQLVASGADRVDNQPLHLRHDVLEHVYLQFGVVLVEVPLEITVTHLVASLELSKVFSMLLYCIIGQMYKLITKVIKIKLPTTSPYIPILIKVPLECLINRSD